MITDGDVRLYKAGCGQPNRLFSMFICNRYSIVQLYKPAVPKTALSLGLVYSNIDRVLTDNYHSTLHVRMAI